MLPLLMGRWKMTCKVRPFLSKLSSPRLGMEENEGICFATQREKACLTSPAPNSCVEPNKGITCSYVYAFFVRLNSELCLELSVRVTSDH